MDWAVSRILSVFTGKSNIAISASASRLSGQGNTELSCGICHQIAGEVGMNIVICTIYTNNQFGQHGKYLYQDLDLYVRGAQPGHVPHTKEEIEAQLTAPEPSGYGFDAVQFVLNEEFADRLAQSKKDKGARTNVQSGIY